jgi:hypothetical protein
MKIKLRKIPRKEIRREQIIEIIAAILVIIVIAVAVKQMPKEKPIGGDKDEYGCLIAAGYQWCPSTEQCQRMWEEYCEEYKEQFKVTDFESCVKKTGIVMESYPRQCRYDNQTFVEDITISS